MVDLDRLDLLWRDAVYISPASTVGGSPCSGMRQVAGITLDLGVPLPVRGKQTVRVGTNSEAE